MEIYNNTRELSKLETLVKKWKLENKFKDITLIRRLVKINRIIVLDDRTYTLLDEDEKPIFLEKLEIIMKAMDEYYNDLWDIGIDVRVNNDEFRLLLSFVILYPEIHITNSDMDYHDIQNFYLSFKLSKNSFASIEDINLFILNDFRGTRSTYTYAEWMTGYVHSHVSAMYASRNSQVLTRVRLFCVGDGDINMILPQLNSNSDSDLGITVDSIKFLCTIIDTMVSWESIEGVPHIPIKNISSINASNTNRYYEHGFSEGEVYTLYNQLTTLLSEKINIVPKVELTNNNSIVCKMTPELYRKIIIGMLELEQSGIISFSKLQEYIYMDGFIMYNNDDGNNVKKALEINDEHNYLIFNGVRKLLTIVNIDEPDNAEINYKKIRINSNIVKLLLKVFDKIIYDSIIINKRNKLINYEHTAKNKL